MIKRMMTGLLLSALVAAPAMAAQHGQAAQPAQDSAMSGPRHGQAGAMQGGQHGQGGMMRGDMMQGGGMCGMMRGGNKGSMPGGMMGGGMMDGGGPTMDGMRMMMILADTDEDGALSLEEVQAVHARMYRAADADSDGKLTHEEMKAFMHGG